MTQRIVPVWLRWIGSVEVEDIQEALRWDTICYPFDEITVRIDKREAVSSLEVLQRHTLQQCRFSRARLTDDVHMRKAVLPLDPEQISAASKIRLCEIRYLVGWF